MTPLTGEGFLLCLAQLGLGFAGFFGLVITLRQNPSERWSPREIAGIKFILEHSFGIIFLSLAPFLLLYLIGSEQMVWRVANGLLGVLFGVTFFFQLYRLQQVTKQRDSPAYPKLLITLYLIPMALLCLIEVFQSCSGSLFWYSFGLFFLLFQVVAQFYVFLAVHAKAAV